jgi:hypothetical protein
MLFLLMVTMLEFGWDISAACLSGIPLNFLVPNRAGRAYTKKKSNERIKSEDKFDNYSASMKSGFYSIYHGSNCLDILKSCMGCSLMEMRSIY